MEVTEQVDCPEHGSAKVWVVCTHVLGNGAKPPRMCRRLTDNIAAGEVLCSECFDKVEKVETAEQAMTAAVVNKALRVACEPCVLERFKLQDAN